MKPNFFGKRRDLSNPELLSLSLAVAITVIRLPQNTSHATAQVNRTTWASTELLTSAIVVNAPAIYSLSPRKTSNQTPRPDGARLGGQEEPAPTRGRGMRVRYGWDGRRGRAGGGDGPESSNATTSTSMSQVSGRPHSVSGVV